MAKIEGSFDQIAAFVAEANQFWLELFSPNGSFTDSDEYQEEEIFQSEIKKIILSKNLSELKDFMNHYIHVCDELDDKTLANFKKRIFLKSGIALDGVKDVIIQNGHNILNSNMIKDENDYDDLRSFYELLKAKGGMGQLEFAVEDLLEKYAYQYD